MYVPPVCDEDLLSCGVHGIGCGRHVGCSVLEPEYTEHTKIMQI